MKNSNKVANWLTYYCYGLSSKNCPKTQELEEIRNTKAWKKTDKSLVRYVRQGDWAPKSILALYLASLSPSNVNLPTKVSHLLPGFWRSCICTFSTYHLSSISAWSLYFSYLWKLLSLHLKFIIQPFHPSLSPTFSVMPKTHPPH